MVGSAGEAQGTGLPSQSTDGRAAKDYGLDRDTIHRWRKRQKDPRKFDAALEKSQERCVKVCESVAVWEAVLEEEKRLAKERQKLGGRGK